MSRRRRLWLLGILSLIGLSNAGYAAVLPIKSGAYQGDSLKYLGQSKRAAIERQAGTATFTFQRDGKQVVEVLKLTALPPT